MANQILEAFPLREDQIDQIEKYKKQIPLLQNFYDTLIKRTENYLEEVKQHMIKKNMYDADNYKDQVTFTMKVAYMIFTIEVLFFIVKNGANKMKALLKDKDNLREFGLEMERKVKEIEEKHIKSQSQKSEEEKLKLQKDIVKSLNKVMFSSEGVGVTKCKSVLNFIDKVVTAEDLNMLAGPSDFEEFIKINGAKINELKEKNGLKKIDKPRVKNNEEFKIYKK